MSAAVLWAVMSASPVLQDSDLHKCLLICRLCVPVSMSLSHDSVCLYDSARYVCRDLCFRLPTQESAEPQTSDSPLLNCANGNCMPETGVQVRQETLRRLEECEYNSGLSMTDLMNRLYG